MTDDLRDDLGDSACRTNSRGRETVSLSGNNFLCPILYKYYETSS